MPGMKKKAKKKKLKKGEQLALARTGGVGGKRKGAGRKPTPGKRRSVPHRKRPALDGSVPCTALLAPGGSPSHARRGGEREGKALASGLSSFVIRIAKRLNALLRRKGAVWDGRYHRHDLVTPTEVASCIVYVLQNGKKHGHAARDASWLDDFSSAKEFDGWVDVDIDVEGIERSPRTWLLRIGWRRARVPIATTSAPRSMAA